MKALVVIAVTAFFCASFGFFVTQKLAASSNMVTLSDNEMMQRTGGKWTDYLYQVHTGTWAKCPTPSEEKPCPDVSTHSFTYDLYKCVPCNDEKWAWDQKNGCVKTHKSKCATYGDPEKHCNFTRWASARYTGCWTPDGYCSSGSGSDPG